MQVRNQVLSTVCAGLYFKFITAVALMQQLFLLYRKLRFLKKYDIIENKSKKA